MSRTRIAVIILGVAVIVSVITAFSFRDSIEDLVSTNGTENAGSVVSIAGRDIKLPPDVWLESRLTEIYCIKGRECPPVPYYIFRSGDSTLEVDATGTIWGEKLTGNAEDPFAELKLAFEHRK